MTFVVAFISGCGKLLCCQKVLLVKYCLTLFENVSQKMFTLKFGYNNFHFKPGFGNGRFDNFLSKACSSASD